MKILSHPTVTALGIATLCFLPTISTLVEPAHLAIYHVSGSSASIFVPVILDLAVVSLLISIVFRFAQYPGRIATTIWLATIVFLPWILLKSLTSVANAPLHHWLSMSIAGVSVILFLALLLFWRPSFQAPFESARSFVSTLLAFTALSGAVLVLQLLWCSWQAHALNAPRALHQRQSASVGPTPKQRIIWIVLDELSYKQVYERRFPGLQLPAFDRLASQSTVFTHVVPAGIYTQEAVPTLMTGIPVNHIRSSVAGALSIHNASSNTWESFDPHNTVFQDALNGGYTTAIAGWYNPYCRILPQVLDHCFWTNHLALPHNLVANTPLAYSLLDPIPGALSVVCAFAHMAMCPPSRDRNLHVQDYHDIFAAADTLLADPSVNFVFLHLPVPHPDGIYDRKAATFATAPTSYIDNLALADRYLNHLQQFLQQHNAWDSSTIVVMGDHSWRTKLLWSSSPGWTSEDQAASNGGQFDDRPAYIVKLPHQQQPERFDAPFAAVHTRALLDAILSNRIHSPSELSSWASQQASAHTALQ